jgi:hypothetical protein
MDGLRRSVGFLASAALAAADEEAAELLKAERTGATHDATHDPPTNPVGVKIEMGNKAGPQIFPDHV